MLSVHICHQATVIFQWKHCTFRITGSCNTSLQCTMKSKCPLRDSSVCRFKHVFWEKRLIAREPYVRCNDRSPMLPLKKNGCPYDVRGINQHVMCEFITCGFWREMTTFHGSGINKPTYARRQVISFVTKASACHHTFHANHWHCCWKVPPIIAVKSNFHSSS